MVSVESLPGEEIVCNLELFVFSSQGTIRSYDIRKKAAVNTFSTIGEVTAISIHTMSDIVAW